MRLDLRKQILTLVVMAGAIAFSSTFAFAAPSEPRPSAPAKSLREAPAEKSVLKSVEMESVEVREQPQVENILSVPEFSATRVVRQHSRTASAGIWSGALKNREAESAFGFNLYIQNDNINETGQSYGLTVLTNGLLGAHWDYHVNCCLGAYYEPFWGFGLGSLWDPADSLVSFVNVDRYGLRLRGGFEDMFRLKRRLRLESAVQWSPLGISGFLTLGWTFDRNEFWF